MTELTVKLDPLMRFSRNKSPSDVARKGAITEGEQNLSLNLLGSLIALVYLSPSAQRIVQSDMTATWNLTKAQMAPTNHQQEPDSANSALSPNRSCLNNPSITDIDLTPHILPHSAGHRKLCFLVNSTEYILIQTIYYWDDIIALCAQEPDLIMQL